MATKMSDTEYSVQFVVIREIVVKSSDDIQAEKDAFAKLDPRDRASTIASYVLDPAGDNEGALAEDLMDAWQFARDHFGTIDKAWLED